MYFLLFSKKAFPESCLVPVAVISGHVVHQTHRQHIQRQSTGSDFGAYLGSRGYQGKTKQALSHHDKTKQPIRF